MIDKVASLLRILAPPGSGPRGGDVAYPRSQPVRTELMRHSGTQAEDTSDRAAEVMAAAPVVRWATLLRRGLAPEGSFAGVPWSGRKSPYYTIVPALSWRFSGGALAWESTRADGMVGGHQQSEIMLTSFSPASG